MNELRPTLRGVSLKFFVGPTQQACQAIGNAAKLLLAIAETYPTRPDIPVKMSLQYQWEQQGWPCSTSRSSINASAGTCAGLSAASVACA